MENSHRANVLVTSCLKTPVDPHTKAPLALYEREKTLPYAAEHMGQGERPEEVQRLTSVTHPWSFYFSNEEYYRKLEELKRAHLQTMAELEEMYRDKMDIKGTAAQEKECGSPCTAHRSSPHPCVDAILYVENFSVAFQVCAATYCHFCVFFFVLQRAVFMLSGGHIALHLFKPVVRRQLINFVLAYSENLHFLHSLVGYDLTQYGI
uniref:Uncharacterized protein n=1 Tax=Scleropages formosus TaxID=113540 RepID=A0A8C9R101_SCLFO